MENKKLQVNYPDSNNAFRTPLHVCHLSANYSEWHNGPRSKTKKEYIDPIVFNKYENNLIQDSKKNYWNFLPFFSSIYYF